MVVDNDSPMHVCAKCGKGFETNSRFGRNRFYSCRGQHIYPHTYHCNSKIFADTIELHVWNEVVDAVTDYVNENVALDRLLKDFNSAKGGLEQDIAHERKFLELIPKKRAMVMTRERQGNITTQEADLQFKAIAEEQEKHEHEIAKLESQRLNEGNIQKLIESANWLKREFNFGNFDDVPDEQKRVILETVVDKIIIGGDKGVEIRLKLPNLQIIDHTCDCLLGHRLL